MAIIEDNAITHSGLVRDHNEDSIYSQPELGLWVVADGMGGHACGEVASALVVNELQQRAPRAGQLVDAIQSAHSVVVDAAEASEDAKGMGTTVVALCLDHDQYHIAWVGDSRCYRLRHQQLELLTRDHSYLEWLRANGIDVDEARNHPKRNVITQSIGIGEPTVDSVSGAVLPGDRYLLCSDGLNDELTDEEIAAMLVSMESAAQVVPALLSEALAKGGRDNVSIIVVDVEPDERSNSRPPTQPFAWLKRLFKRDRH